MNDDSEWSTDRRRLLQYTAGGGLVALSTDVASSQESGDTITLSGDVRRYNEDSAADQWLTAWAGDRGDVNTDPFHGSGPFEVDVPSGTAVSLSFYQGVSGSDTAVYFDDNPDVYTIGAFKYFEDTDVGPIDLPKGYELDVRVRDEDGFLLVNAPVRVRHDTPEGFTYTTGTTNLDGRFKAPHAEPGIEVEGNVVVRAAPPGSGNPFGSGSDVQVTTRELTVDSDTRVDVTLGDGEPSDTTPEPVPDEMPYTIEYTPLAASGQSAFFEIELTANDVSTDQFAQMGPVVVATGGMDARIAEVHPVPTLDADDEFLSSVAGTVAIHVAEEAAKGIPVGSLLEILQTIREYNFERETTGVQRVDLFGGEGLSIHETLAAGPSVRFQVRLESEGPDLDHWGSEEGDLQVGQEHQPADAAPSESIQFAPDQFFSFPTDEY